MTCTSYEIKDIIYKGNAERKHNKRRRKILNRNLGAICIGLTDIAVKTEVVFHAFYDTESECFTVNTLIDST